MDNKEDIKYGDEEDWYLLENQSSPNLCNLFYKYTKDFFTYSRTKKSFYMFNQKINLWVGGNEYIENINFKFTEVMHAILNNIACSLPISNNESERMERIRKLKLIEQAKKLSDGSYGVKIVKNFLPGVFNPDIDPAILFDQYDDLLPLENGIWSFSENKLIDYDKKYYFTFKIPIKYNSDANISDIELAMKQWFAYDEEIVDFIHYYIGYCLTGYTCRQDAIIAWGQNACNGKSTLWGDILDILLGDEKYYESLKSEDISKGKSGNNDGLYRLEGKRFAHIDEPRKESGNSIDNEIFKYAIGSKKMKEGAKYKERKGFVPKFKLVITCNSIPDLNFEDKGVYRRLIILKQNVEFLNKDDYDKASELQKNKHEIALRDDSFITRVISNKEGLMKWAIEGSKKFMKDKMKPVPLKLLKIKEEVKEEKNIISEWINRNLEKSDNDIPLSQLKLFWKKYDIDFGQKKHGFNKHFLTECEKLGYKTNSGRQG
jgi:P4 family phage/plasmid primase-like protien